jgi:hypothetical protein
VGVYIFSLFGCLDKDCEQIGLNLAFRRIDYDDQFLVN